MTPASLLPDPSVNASAEAAPEPAGSRSGRAIAGDSLLDGAFDVVELGLGADCSVASVAAGDDVVVPDGSAAAGVGVGATGGGVGVAAAGVDVDVGAEDSVVDADPSPTDPPAETGPADVPPGWGDPAFDVVDGALSADDGNCAGRPITGR